LELAAEQLRWWKPWVENDCQERWAVADGGYAKKPFLQAAKAADYTVVSRLRDDQDVSGDVAARGRADPRSAGPGEGRLVAILLRRSDSDASGDPGGDGRSQRRRADVQGRQRSLGAGQQQVRKVYSNAGCFNLNLWRYSLVETWAWEQQEEALVDRVASPWDSEPRRPSHQDKRQALQREVLQAEIAAALSGRPTKERIRALAERLLDRAA
jgi:hypothetical protein